MLRLHILAAQHVYWDFDGRHIVHIEFTVLPLRCTGQRPVDFNVEGTNWSKTVLLEHLIPELLLHGRRHEVVEVLV